MHRGSASPPSVRPGEDAEAFLAACESLAFVESDRRTIVKRALELFLKIDKTSSYFHEREKSATYIETRKKYKAQASGEVDDLVEFEVRDQLLDARAEVAVADDVEVDVGDLFPGGLLDRQPGILSLAGRCGRLARSRIIRSSGQRRALTADDKTHKKYMYLYV